MEFCPEFAVFHSSVGLADRLCPNGLKSFTRDASYSESVLQVICESVQEISRGLSADITEPESDHWNLMLTALSTWKSISCIQELNTFLPVQSNVVRLLRPLPDWNAVFYHDLIGRNKWGKQFIRVLDVLEISTGLSVLHLILSQFNEMYSPNTEDSDVVAAIIEYLCLIENKYLPYLIWNDRSGSVSESGKLLDKVDKDKKMLHLIASLPGDQRKWLRNCMRFENSSEDSQDLILRDLSKSDGFRETCLICLFKAIRWIFAIEIIGNMSDGEKVSLFSSVFSLLNMFVGGNGYVFQGRCLFRNVSRKVGTSGAVKRLAGDQIADSLVLFTFTDLPLMRIKPPRDFILNPILFEGLIEILRVTEDFERICYKFSDSFCQIRPNNFQCMLNLDRELYVSSCQHIFTDAFSHLQDDAGRISDVKFKQSLHRFLVELKPTYCMVRDFVQNLEAKSALPTQMFERALLRIQQKSPDAKDHFIWLIETDCEEICKDPRWLKCIEECCKISQFFDEKLVVRLLSTFRRIKHKLDEQALKTFQTVVLRSYRSLSLDQQNIVLEEFYERSTVAPFKVDERKFQQEFAELFRELTNAIRSESREKMIGISCLVLQHPYNAVGALVASVVQNKQYADIFVEVLLTIPLMAKLESHDGCLVIFDCVESHLRSGKRSKTAQMHVLSLFRHLLTTETNRRSLCRTEQFLHTCIFSHGNRLITSFENQSELSSVSLSLSLLLIAFEVLDGTEITWSVIESHGVLPLVVWICSILDSCRSLWTRNCETPTGRIKVKEMALKILSLLMSTLRRCEVDKISDDRLIWLWGQLSRRHWTVVLYVKPLFIDSPFAQSMLPVELAEFLSGSCRRLTQRRLFMLLDVCRILRDDMKLPLGRLQSTGAVVVPSNFYQTLVHSLSEILFNSVRLEWFDVADVLKQFLFSDFVPRKISDVLELSVCDIFVDAVALKKETISDNKSEISMFLHAVQCFSEYFKDSVLRLLHRTNDVVFASRCLYVVTRLWSIVPKACTMPLFNLVLEVCTLLSNSAKSAGVDPETKRLVQCAVDEVNQIVHL